MSENNVSETFVKSIIPSPVVMAYIKGLMEQGHKLAWIDGSGNITPVTEAELEGKALK